MLNTSQKIFVGRIVSSVFIKIRRLLALSPNVTATRKGITWSLDLTEGIDLAIYMLGGFKLGIINKCKKVIRQGDVVLDIGANIGGQTLQLAQLVGNQGKVIAIEPTQYAFKKLEKNIRLNPTLSPRIRAEQLLIVKNNLKELPPSIYSSWPLKNGSNVHKEHHGQLKSTQGAMMTTLDQYVQSSNLERINFIKLDVDGYEYDVLTSGQETLKRFKPFILMELAPYNFESCPQNFDEILKLLWSLHYEIIDTSNGKKLPNDTKIVHKYILPRGEIHVLASCIQHN